MNKKEEMRGRDGERTREIRRQDTKDEKEM